VNYGGISAKAYVTEYDDPGPEFAKWSHGYIGEVLTALLGDIATEDSVVPSEVQLIEILLGEDMKAHLDAHIAEDFGPLREVIDKKLEDFVKPYGYAFRSVRLALLPVYFLVPVLTTYMQLRFICSHENHDAAIYEISTLPIDTFLRQIE